MGLLEDVFGRQYRYYDSPDGQDCLKKLGFITKYCGIYGILFSSADVLMISHPKGYPQIFARYAAITLPFMGMGAAFSVTSCIATSYRKKDDIWNYYLGGAAAGAVAGAAKKSLKVGSYSAIFLGAAAAVKKDFDLRGWKLISTDAPKKTGDFRMFKRDFSITADPAAALLSTLSVSGPLLCACYLCLSFYLPCITTELQVLLLYGGMLEFQAIFDYVVKKLNYC